MCGPALKPSFSPAKAIFRDIGGAGDADLRITTGTTNGVDTFVGEVEFSGGGEEVGVLDVSSFDVDATDSVAELSLLLLACGAEGV